MFFRAQLPAGVEHGHLRPCRYAPCLDTGYQRWLPNGAPHQQCLNRTQNSGPSYLQNPHSFASLHFYEHWTHFSSIYIHSPSNMHCILCLDSFCLSDEFSRSLRWMSATFLRHLWWLTISPLFQLPPPCRPILHHWFPLPRVYDAGLKPMETQQNDAYPHGKLHYHRHLHPVHPSSNSKSRKHSTATSALFHSLLTQLPRASVVFIPNHLPSIVRPAARAQTTSNSAPNPLDHPQARPFLVLFGLQSHKE